MEEVCETPLWNQHQLVELVQGQQPARPPATTSWGLNIWEAQGLTSSHWEDAWGAQRWGAKEMFEKGLEHATVRTRINTDMGAGDATAHPWEHFQGPQPEKCWQEGLSGQAGHPCFS